MALPLLTSFCFVKGEERADSLLGNMKTVKQKSAQITWGLSPAGSGALLVNV